MERVVRYQGSAAGGVAQATVLPASPVTGRWVELLILATALSAANYARTALSPLQEAMRTALSLSDNQMAILQGPALALPLVMAAIPLGLVIDRFSRVRLLVVFAALTILGSLLTAASSHFTVIFAARCLIGLMASAISITTLSLVADYFGPAKRGRATMVLGIGEIGGASAAFALGGALLGVWDSSPSSWQSAMYALTAPLALVAFLLLGIREPPRTSAGAESQTSRESFLELWRYRAVIVPLLLGKIMVVSAYGAVVIWAAPALTRTFGLSPERIGAIMATCLLVSGLLGPVAGGTVADLCQRTGGPRRTMTALSGLCLLSVPAGLFAIAPSAIAAIILLFVFKTIFSVIGIAEMTLSTVVIPNRLRGLCLSVLVAVGLIFGAGVVPVAISLLSEQVGGGVMISRALAAVCVLTGILGAVTFGFGRRYLPSAAAP